MEQRIKFSGGSNVGYEASLGGLRVNVRRDGDKFWEASYTGNPMLHNPIVPVDNGRVSVSCSCPTIKVGNGFEKRKDAAEAALDVLRKETRNWGIAQRDVNEANPNASFGVRLQRARDRYQEITA